MMAWNKVKKPLKETKMENDNREKWYQKKWGIIFWLILFFPLGLFLMWKHSDWSKKTKWIITGIFVFLILVSSTDSDSTPTNDSGSVQNDIQESPTDKNEQESEAETNIETREEEVEKQVLDNPETSPSTNDDGLQSETVSQKNAIRKAESYLDFTAFSREGLIDQLEFDGFPSEDAVYAVDKVGADWNVQAEKKAKAYLDFTAFSRSGLIEQLEFDGFTNAQATHGADSVGL